MKKAICTIFIIFTCGISLAVSKDDLTSIFYSANKLYEQGKYEEAAGEYKKIIDMGYQSGPLYYNLGNCYFKLGFLGKTILYYEKAKRLIPDNPELRFNYNYVQSLLIDKIQTPKNIWFSRYFLKIAKYLSFGRWLGFIIMIWLLLIILLVLNIFISGYKKLFRYIGILLCAIFIISAICAIIQYSTYASPTAIITEKEVPVRYGPGEAEVEAFLLHEGTKTAVIKEKDNWYQIQLPDGKTGWLPKDAIEII